jgi:hypothetical protein
MHEPLEHVGATARHRHDAHRERQQQHHDAGVLQASHELSAMR